MEVPRPHLLKLLPLPQRLWLPPLSRKNWSMHPSKCRQPRGTLTQQPRTTGRSMTTRHRILMSWTFLRETSWRSSWKGRMAGGLWNEMDNVALSLGHTWRSSEERPAVPTYLCPDCEVKDCSHHRPGLAGSEPWLAALGMGWLLATLNKLLPGVKGQAHPSFAGVLFSYPVPRVLIQKARVQGVWETRALSLTDKQQSGPVSARDRGEAFTQGPAAPRLPELHSYLGQPGRRK